MAEKKTQKYDKNTEIFQMRAQWKKIDICKKTWHIRWSWLLDERKYVKYLHMFPNVEYLNRMDQCGN